MQEHGDQRGQSQAHPGPNLRTAVILVAPEMTMEEVAVDGDRDRQDFLGAQAMYRFEAGVALAVGKIASAVADAANPELSARRDRHQPRSKREK
jgi:hypothetical protein